MININEYLLSNKHKNAITGIKIPDNIPYAYKNVSVKDLITDVLYNFGEIISRNDLDKAFEGYEKSEFNVIGWYFDANNAYRYEDILNKMFPSDYADTYLSYLDDADLCLTIDEDTNAIIVRFISQDDKAIYIIDTGDNGYIYLCIEKYA